jgi:3,4-dihydroxy 2-butanone 4-phosphate synthase/GTP cyclohydrolase II
VLVRAGHTEAAVDVARLAGLNPSGVICEIMRDDGTMARMDDLVSLAQRHNLKIGTIRDLIAYRRRYDHDVVKVSEARFDSIFGGEWRIISFRNKVLGNETIALLKGEIEPDKPTLVRMHQLDFFNDTLGEIGDRTGILQSSMRTIDEEGNGLVVLINRQMPDAFSRIVDTRNPRRSDGSADVSELRDYGIGAQVLAELGVHQMILLTNTPHTLVALSGYGLEIVGERPVPPFIYGSDAYEEARRKRVAW